MKNAFHYLGPEGDEVPMDVAETLEAMHIPVPQPIEIVVPPAAPTGNPKDALGLAKPDLSVIPPSAELHLASAMMDGAVKYGAFNWRENDVLCRVYIAAARRHLLQYLDGENFDPVSNVHHLGHAMACCAIILDAYETGNLIDNRPKKGAAPALIREWDGETKFSRIVRAFKQIFQ